VPLVLPILVLLPYVAVRVYQHNHLSSHILGSFAQNSPDLATLTDMLENKPVAWTGDKPERVHAFEEPDYTGFQILQDSRILDLRAWPPGGAHDGDEPPLAHIYRRLKVHKLRENTGNDQFRLPLSLTSPKSQIRFPPPRCARRTSSLRPAAGKNVAGR
jgi:hypothetical protein